MSITCIAVVLTQINVLKKCSYFCLLFTYILIITNQMNIYILLFSYLLQFLSHIPSYSCRSLLLHLFSLSLFPFSSLHLSFPYLSLSLHLLSLPISFPLSPIFLQPRECQQHAIFNLVNGQSIFKRHECYFVGGHPAIKINDWSHFFALQEREKKW